MNQEPEARSRDHAGQQIEGGHVEHESQSQPSEPRDHTLETGETVDAVHEIVCVDHPDYPDEGKYVGPVPHLQAPEHCDPMPGIEVEHKEDRSRAVHNKSKRRPQPVDIVKITDQRDQESSDKVAPRKGIEREIRDRKIRGEAYDRDDQAASVGYGIAVQTTFIRDSEAIPL